MVETLTLQVNGKEHTVDINPETPLLYVLRNELQLNGPKFGCGLQQCGACMVLVDGEARPSCRFPVKTAVDSEIRTLAGLIKEDGELHPVQQAFVEEQAAQCGYCLNGMVMSAVSLLEKKQDPTEEEIREALAINICRCGVHSRVIKAVTSVVKKVRP
ncbi:MAG: (2Fe-2S)-binding protein [Pseudozobellia sp.]|nr:(2Fe-2S)-binding protein [Pseudozobellia sp.]MBG49977.1 (2Fe-2S)-binding protein [Pseudozobellia sp.]|tara:strand:- start:1153 stop:1626 length:474 start_codon:yes stop_codon:yes gene_type:complete